MPLSLPQLQRELAQSHFTPSRAQKRAFTRDFVHKSGSACECPAALLLPLPLCTPFAVRHTGGSASIYNGMRLREIAAEISAFSGRILRIKWYYENKKTALILKHSVFLRAWKDARIERERKNKNYFTQLMFQQKTIIHHYLCSFLRCTRTYI